MLDIVKYIVIDKIHGDIKGGVAFDVCDIIHFALQSSDVHLDLSLLPIFVYVFEYFKNVIECAL